MGRPYSSWLHALRHLVHFAVFGYFTVLGTLDSSLVCIVLIPLTVDSSALMTTVDGDVVLGRSILSPLMSV
jgi:hypothetical protein